MIGAHAIRRGRIAAPAASSYTVERSVQEDAPIDDAPLLSRVATGEPNAIETCLDAYGSLVWSLARRFLKNASDAEDAVQEIFVDVWSNAYRFDPTKSSEKTFIAMIARRRLIDRCRRDRARPSPEALPAPGELPADLDALELIETRDEAARIAELIGTLRPEQQQVLELSIYEGWTHTEIAEHLSMPLGTIKTHIRRGLIQVRELLARESDADPE